MSGNRGGIVEATVSAEDRDSGAAEATAGAAGRILRDGGAVVDFRLLNGAGVVGLHDTATPDAVRAAVLCGRLRDRLAAAAPPPARPSLSVAICTKDRPDWLARLLASLAPEQAALGFEILVVDNNSTSDATRQVATAAPGVRYLHEPLTGLDFARNRALAAATGAVIACLDDDVTVEPGWAAARLDTWARNPDAGAITGLVMPMALDTEAQILFEARGGFRRGFRPLRYGATAFRDRLHPSGAGRFGAGANMSFDRALILSLGAFDEALDTGRPLPGGGDIDMFHRVLRAGRPLVYEPRAMVRHDHRRDLAVLRHQYYTWGLGFAAFLVKSMRTDPAARPALRGMALWWARYQIGRVALRLRGREPTPMAMIWGEIWGGLKGFCGEYDRSCRRSAAIRQAAAGETAEPSAAAAGTAPAEADAA
jgi:glycosyltransferase involved in cell wall biosynthesis